MYTAGIEPMPKRSRAARQGAALGFRAHSGWAALVAVAGPAAEPAAVLRRRVELSGLLPRQPFHAAEGLRFAEADDLVRRAAEEASVLAEHAVRDALGELPASGDARVAVGLLLAAGRPLPGLPQILASHALIHAAEGELFRDVLRRAAHACGLAVVEVRERELEGRAERSLRRPRPSIRARLARWGKALGPPWTQDEKQAALAAWLALAEASGAAS